MAFPLQSVGLDLYGLGSKLLTRSWDLQRSYAFQLVMPSDIGGFFGFEVSQYCMAAKIGDYDITEISKMKYGPQQRFYAGLQGIDRCTLSFINPTNNAVYNYFLEWSYLAIDRQGYYHVKRDYAKDIYVVTYDQRNIETNKFRLRGCFPTMRPKPDVSYAKEDIMWITISLSVDAVEVGSVFSEITSLLRRGKQLTRIFT